MKIENSERQSEKEQKDGANSSKKMAEGEREKDEEKIEKGGRLSIAWSHSETVEIRTRERASGCIQVSEG